MGLGVETRCIASLKAKKYGLVSNIEYLIV
jgi:hypothetical protein